MSGLCLVAGASDARARVERMLARMSGFSQKTASLALGPELAVGRAFHGRLASERAPETAEDGVTALVDGEIFDDRGPLADPSAAIGDLYRADGLDRIAYLNGDFSAIVVDARKKRVVLATDRLGSHTLFVWRRNGALAVSSRLDALLADDRVTRRLSLQGLAELLSYQRTVADHTQYAGIRAMPAAQVWSFSEGRASERQTRRLAWREPDFGPAEGARRLASSFKEAVGRRTKDPVRHGLLLSGGLDSRWMMAAARAAGATLSCVTVASHDNFEVAIARAAAARAGMPFRYLPNPPASLSRNLDAATRSSDGLFAAPINLFGQLPEIAQNHDVLLSGHGLDYTLRGYYLPCLMVRVAGSITRLPRLRPVSDGSPETVAGSLRIGIKGAALEAVLAPSVRADWEARRLSAMATALAAADIDDPYNAWDAFVLHCLGRHYAYSDFVAMRSVIGHRPVAFDPAVFDLYLAMKPAWRASGRMAQAAMKALGPDLMELPDANSGLSAHHGFSTQILLLFARAAVRRVGLMRAPTLADPTFTHGSWSNYDELLRRDPLFVERLEGLSRNQALLDTGLFDSSGLKRIAGEQLGARANHSKLLLELLTIASWLERHDYTGVDHGG